MVMTTTTTTGESWLRHNDNPIGGGGGERGEGGLNKEAQRVYIRCYDDCYYYYYYSYYYHRRVIVQTQWSPYMRREGGSEGELRGKEDSIYVGTSLLRWWL